MTARSVAVTICISLLIAATSIGCGADDGGTSLPAASSAPSTAPSAPQTPAAAAGRPSQPLTAEGRARYEQALARLGQGDMEGAFTLAGSALASSPASPEPYRLVSKIMTEAGRDPEAIELFGEIATRFPGYSHAWFYRGFHEFHLQRWPEAIESFSRASELDPTHAESQIRRGLVLQYMGRFEEAVAAFERGHDLEPSGTNAVWFAGALRQSGEYERARDVLDRALANDPDSAAVHYAVAQIQLRAREPGAEASLRRAIELNPALAKAHRDLAGVLFRRGETGEAERESLLAGRLEDDVRHMSLLMDRLGVSPGEPLLPLYLAELDLTAGRLEAARRWYARAAALDGPAGRIAVGRAELAARGGDADLAERFLGAPGAADDPRAVVPRVLILLVRGDRQQAVKLLNAVTADTTLDRDATLRVGDLYSMLGQQAEASATLARAMTIPRAAIP